ncbi:metalloregulator ArsR/SmtB family transcription factor [Paraflavitalea sp. CAU 1676]|uniref:ArsR/SmtB family transcription factor n=1 Tax=Paraflavitalea sp. CAU 1676 TaxID=3032598 RepID=UPI0023DCBF11|nr:metalloregulator ArsR/SmtB family transcription factor [Paraflavitalea sp. CAU 1676]MDF2191561.1 metalloregulator ArsR/SmtB family transcription factor [Paraflavitalea sp. CAU 1676]
MRRDVFQAIADPTRRAIIGLVAFNALNLNAIAENFDVSRPAISQHIKILTECGLIEIKQQGRERMCEARLEALQDIAEWLEPFRKAWEHKFDALDALLLRMQPDEEPAVKQGAAAKNEKRGPGKAPKGKRKK